MANEKPKSTEPTVEVTPVAPVASNTAEQVLQAFANGTAKTTIEVLGEGKRRQVTVINGEVIEMIIEDGTETFR